MTKIRIKKKRPKVIRIRANDWNPELHPRDAEGKFTEIPGSGVLDKVRDIYTSATNTVRVGGKTVETNPITRDGFGRDNTELKDAALDELDNSFVESSAYGSDTHGAESDFDAWRVEEDGSLLNENTAELWGAAIDDTGNDNIPNNATAEPQTYGDPLPAVEGNDPTTAIGDSVSVTRDVMQDLFGDEVPVVRGVSGEFAEQIKEARENGEDIELNHRALESWSTFPDHAKQFAEEGDGEGVLIQTTVPVDRIYGASHTTPGLHEEENEIIAALDSSESYSPGQIYDPTEEGMEEIYNTMREQVAEG